MPLKKGSSSKVIQKNIEELIKAGNERTQAVAIAYKEAHKEKERPQKKGKK